MSGLSGLELSYVRKRKRAWATKRKSSGAEPDTPDIKGSAEVHSEPFVRRIGRL